MSPSHSWDVFCHVVDNLGDIGVCWRLARQLASEHAAEVRLWLDDLASLHLLCPEADPARECQQVEGVEVRRWDKQFPAVTPAAIAVDAFGCGLPEPYVEAMVHRDPKPLWIILEYLSAEPWVREHHGLPSPHPRLPLDRYFFFPGFVAGTGGVPREKGLLARRDAFGTEGRSRFWTSVGFEPPPPEADVVSLFGYRDAPVADLLASCERGERLTVMAVPDGQIVAPVLDFLGAAEPAAGRVFRRRSLEVRIVPFLAQPRYDELLWACDCNFVRGEDSFLRAQWAARPFVWHIYPQPERAHWRKLEAFLDVYCDRMPASLGLAVQEMWRKWNSMNPPGVDVGEVWKAFRDQRQALEAHAREWAARLEAVGDLAGRLAQFCQDRLQ